VDKGVDERLTATTTGCLRERRRACCDPTTSNVRAREKRGATVSNLLLQLGVFTAPRFPSQRQQRRRRRRKEPPPGPVRPLSAYNYFFRDERERWLAERETQGSHTEKARELFSIMGKAIAQRWKSLNAEAVAKYDRIAEQDRERYQRERKLYLEEKAQSRNAEAEEHTDRQLNKPSASADATDPPAKKKRATTAATAKDSVTNRPNLRKNNNPSTKKSKRQPSLTKDSSLANLTSRVDAAAAGSHQEQSRSQLAAADGGDIFPALPQSDFYLSQLLSEALARHQTAYLTSFTAAATEAAAAATATETAPFADSLPANPRAWIPFTQGPVDESTTTRIAPQAEQHLQPSWHRPLTLLQQQFHPHLPQATATTSSSALLDQKECSSHEAAGSQSDLIRALLNRMEQQRQLSQLEQQQQELSQLEQQHRPSQLEQLSQRSMPPLQHFLPHDTNRLDVYSRGNPQSFPLEESFLLRAMLNQTVWPGFHGSGSQQQQHRHEEYQDTTLDLIRAESTRGTIGGNVDHFPSLNEIIAASLQAQQHGDPMQEVPYHRPHPLLANSSISSLLHRPLEETQPIYSGDVAALESSYIEQLRQQTILEQQALRERDSQQQQPQPQRQPQDQQQQQQQQQRVEENILQIVARLQQEREKQHVKDQTSLPGKGR